MTKYKCYECNNFEMERREINFEFGYVLLCNRFKSIGHPIYLGFANTPRGFMCMEACKNFKNYDEEWLE